MAAKGLLLRLKDYQAKASAAEKNAVAMIRNHPEQVIGTSVHEFANQAYASAATIIRLCRKLGCDGYRDFQHQLVYETALFRDSREISVQEIIPTKYTDTIIREVTRKNIESLETSRKLVDAADIDACVHMMGKSRMIQLFGIGSSLLVARDLYLKLLRVEISCNLCDDWHAQLLAARTMKKGDLAIVISYSGLTVEMVTCAATARANGAQVIVLTRAADSPLAAEADCVLTVAATELILRSGAMSSRISQLNMVDILYVAYVNRHYEHCMKSFPKTHIQKPMEE